MSGFSFFVLTFIFFFLCKCSRNRARKKAPNATTLIVIGPDFGFGTWLWADIISLLRKDSIKWWLKLGLGGQVVLSLNPASVPSSVTQFPPATTENSAITCPIGLSWKLNNKTKHVTPTAPYLAHGWRPTNTSLPYGGRQRVHTIFSAVSSHLKSCNKHFPSCFFLRRPGLFWTSGPGPRTRSRSRLASGSQWLRTHSALRKNDGKE